MDVLTSGRFIFGLILGAVAYHLWMMRMARKSTG